MSMLKYVTLASPTPQTLPRIFVFFQHVVKRYGINVPTHFQLFSRTKGIAACNFKLLQCYQGWPIATITSIQDFPFHWARSPGRLLAPVGAKLDERTACPMCCCCFYCQTSHVFRSDLMYRKCRVYRSGLNVRIHCHWMTDPWRQCSVESESCCSQILTNHVPSMFFVFWASFCRDNDKTYDEWCVNLSVTYCA